MPQPSITTSGSGYQVMGQGPAYSSIDAAWQAYQNSLNSGGAAPSAPSTPAVDPYKTYQDNITGIRTGLESQYGYKAAADARAAAQKSLTDFQFQDLSKVFKDEADRLGLTEISNSIASLSKERQKQQRTLEDLPDTILGISRDVGISEGQLNRQTAVESRPIIRNISDLLSSVSILGDQYNRGMQQAQYSTGLAGQQDQNNYSKLTQGYGFANDAYNDISNTINSLFPQLASGVITPAQQAAAAEQKRQAELDEAYRRDSLLQDESQFSRSLAQDADQFNRTPRGGGPGGGGDPAGPADFYTDAAEFSRQLAAGDISRSNAWWAMKKAYPSKTDQEIDDALGFEQANTSSAPRKSAYSSFLDSTRASAPLKKYISKSFLSGLFR